MSRAVKQPVGQKRLTNIAVVRLKKNGKRFEIACYRNKVSDWRAGIEKDLDEVLQTTAIFANVGKGVMAAKEDLQEAFGTTDEDKICLEILSKGELQVSDKERQAQQDNLYKDVAGVLVEKTVNPDTSRPYTLTMLERALKDIHFNPDPKKSAKQQALEVLPVLQERFPIQRARMRLKLQVPVQYQQDLLENLDASAASVEEVDSSGSTSTIIAQVEPGVFRNLHHFMQDITHRTGRIEVLSFAVTVMDGGSEDFNTLSAPSTAPPPVPSTLASVAEGLRGTGDAEASVSGKAEPAGGMQQHAARAQRGAAAAGGEAAGSSGRVLYAKGLIEGLPEEYASRKERFAELDQLQAGWQVELRSRGDTVDAVFYAPDGALVGTYATARRQALAAHKAAAAGQ